LTGLTQFVRLVSSMRNPFTPGSGLFPPYFADREREVREFRQRLLSTIEGKPRHLAVLGEWATGKTSLLIQLRRLAREEGALATLSVANPEETQAFIGSLIRTLSLEVQAAYGESLWKRLAKAVGLQAVSLSALGASLEFRFASAGEAQLSLREYLRSLWEQLRDPGCVPAVLIAIDDLDLIPDFRQTMVLLRNTAMELGLTGAKVMIVVAGTPVLFEKMWEAHAPLVRFFEPLELGCLPEEAAREAVTKPLEGSGVRFEPEVVERIARLSQGQPYYLQELAYHAFETAQDGVATLETFALAFERAFSTIAKTVFERRVAGLSAGEQKLLGVVATLEGPATHGEIVARAVQAGLKKGSVPKLLQRLKEKGCVRQVETGPQKGRYFLEDPLFAEYVRRRAV